MKRTTLRHLRVLQSYQAEIIKRLNVTGERFEGDTWIRAKVVDEAIGSLGQEALRVAMMIQYEEELAEAGEGDNDGK